MPTSLLAFLITLRSLIRSRIDLQLETWLCAIKSVCFPPASTASVLARPQVLRFCAQICYSSTEGRGLLILRLVERDDE